MDDTFELRTFSQLFLDYQGRFIHFAESYIKDISASEDIVVEAFMYYWENRNSLAPGSNIPAYVLTIVKHKCINYLEHIRVRIDVEQQYKEQIEWDLNTRISGLSACNPSELFTSEMREIVNRTLQSLPEQTRLVFIMSRYEHKSHKEISEQLDMTTKGVEYHITKALKELRINLGDYFPFFLLLLSSSSSSSY